MVLTGTSGFSEVELSSIATMATDKLTLIPYAIVRLRNRSATMINLIPMVGPVNQQLLIINKINGYKILIFEIFLITFFQEIQLPRSFPYCPAVLFEPQCSMYGIHKAQGLPRKEYLM